MEQWIITKDTRVAAAFGTLGVPVRLKTTLIEQTGETVTRFFLGLVNIAGTVRTGALKRQWEAGELEKTTPAHPFLTVLRAMENRVKLLDFLHQNVRCHLVETAAQGIWQYVPGGDGLPGVAGRPELFTTMDVKLVAALGVIGLPLLKVEGNAGNRKFWLPLRGAPHAAGLPPIHAADFATAWRLDKESIPWADPFAQAMRGLRTREQLLDALKKEIALVMIRKPKSRKSAFIRADASPKAWDQMKDFFDR
jgi:hypothetical protein